MFFSGQPWGQASRWLGLAITLTASILSHPTAFPKDRPAAPDTVSLSRLPTEAQTTERLIRTGGPFPFPRKDGSVFGNRERRLAPMPRGFYREYTVRSPDSRDRGAKRIVCGGQRPTLPEACFYTDDHYASFKRIVQ